MQRNEGQWLVNCHLIGANGRRSEFLSFVTCVFQAPSTLDATRGAKQTRRKKNIKSNSSVHTARTQQCVTHKQQNGTWLHLFWSPHCHDCAASNHPGISLPGWTSTSFSASLSVSVSVFLCLFLSVCISLCLFLCISLSHFVSLSVSFSLQASLSLSFFALCLSCLSSLFATLSVFLYLSLSLYLYLSVSLYLSLSLSLSVSFSLSLSLFLSFLSSLSLPLSVFLSPRCQIAIAWHLNSNFGNKSSRVFPHKTGHWTLSLSAR